MPTIHLDQIAKSYGRRRVFGDVGVSLSTGLTLLTGPSGNGKSTLLRLIATAERPSAGSISWNGEKLPRGRRALRRALGYAPQSVDLPEDLTGREFALHMAALKGLDRTSSNAQFAAITARIGLRDAIDDRIASYSGGMHRRLIFAQALLGAPELVALDEPTAELDDVAARHVSELVLDQALTAIVVVTTHLADLLLPHATTVLRVEGGTVRAA
jgi:ABC-2 type transport system ATP-binding protein